MLTIRYFMRMQKLGTRLGSFTANREAKMLQKLIETGETKRKRKMEMNSKMSCQSFPFARGPEFLSKRLAMLNKAYLIHISQVIACGKNSYKLESLGIEITGVKTDKSLQNIKIFWQTRNPTAEVEEIDSVLKSAAGELQYELNVSRVMGKCPNILFVRDITSEKLLQIENSFNQLNLDEKDNLAEPSSNEKDTTNHIESAMKHDVFGLDHSKIMDGIKSKINHKKAVNINGPELTAIEKETYNSSDLIPFCKSQFSKFYKKKRVLYKKIKRNCDINSDDFNEEMDNSQKSYYEDEPYVEK